MTDSVDVEQARQSVDHWMPVEFRNDADAISQWHADVDALIEAVRAEGERVAGPLLDAGGQIDRMDDRITELEEALRPFLRLGAVFHDGYCIHCNEDLGSWTNIEDPESEHLSDCVVMRAREVLGE